MDYKTAGDIVGIDQTVFWINVKPAFVVKLVHGWLLGESKTLFRAQIKRARAFSTRWNLVDTLAQMNEGRLSTTTDLLHRCDMLPRDITKIILTIILDDFRKCWRSF